MRRGLSVAELTDRQREFLSRPFLGVATTLRPDGSPHCTVVWVDVDHQGPSFNTALGRTKTRNLEHDARVALTVVDPTDAFRWIAIDGRATLATEGADAQMDRLAMKYFGKPKYRPLQEGERRVIVRIRPERITAIGLD